MSFALNSLSLSFYSPAQASYRFMGMSPVSPVSSIRFPGTPEGVDEKASSGNPVMGQPDLDTYECQTCKNRRYQDGSNDPGVSFKTPTRLSPERAAFAIRAHESEHVARAWSQAQKENKEVVSQSVSYHTDICPECGKTYLSGGTTRTVFRSKPETYEEAPIKKGAFVDQLA